MLKSFNLKNQSHLKTKILLITTSSLAFLILIISSFFDKQIIEFFVSLGKTSFFRYISAISYDFGRMILAHFVAPICLLILFDGLLYKYQNKKIFNQIYKQRIAVLCAIYLIAIASLHLFTYVKGILELVVYVKNKTGNQIQASQIYLEQLITGGSSGGIQIILTTINLIANIILFIFLIKPKLVNKSFLTGKFYKPALVIIIGTLFSYFVLIIIKHAFGRPGYLNVAGTNESAAINGLNTDLSVESFFAYYNWGSFNSDGLEKYSNASYYEGGQPNNTLKNGVNGFTVPENVGVDKGDHYGDMDFPSGHTVSFANGLSMAYFFYYSENYKRNKKFNHTQKLFIIITILLFIICILGLMILMLHWPSDIAFSLFMVPIIFGLSLKLCKHFKFGNEE